MLVGSGAVVAVGAGTAVGGGDVGSGAGVSGSGADSHANTKSIVDSAATAAPAMLLVYALRIRVFVGFIGLDPRLV